jgi:parvulin-like peptidyl-prolyl isomerase
MLSFLRGGGKRTKTIWWVLVFVTVVTFLGGFVFLLGAGMDSVNRARMTGAVGTINNETISRTEYQVAVGEQRDAWRRQNGSDPGARDLRTVELQAWRSLVIQRLLAVQARKLGLKPYDHEVVVALRTSPPPQVMESPAFKTDGKFDYSKYQAVLADPGNAGEVARLEEETRRTLPMRKLQERLLSSVKLAEPEVLQIYHQRYDRVSATLVLVSPAEGQAPIPTDADIQRLYEKYKSRFTFGPRTQVEVLRVPKDFGDEEVRSARELATSLVRRIRNGESFAAMARDYSEGPAAERGGEIDRVFAPPDLGAELGPKIAALDTGAVTDPIQDGGGFRIFKLLQKTADPQTGAPGVRMAQILVEVKPNETRLSEQYQSLVKVRNQAAKIGLGQAAAIKAMPTATTGYFDANNAPPELFGAPEAADWALGAKQGAVSPVFQGNDEFVTVQVSQQRAAGPAPREEINEQLRRLAEIDARVEKNKPQADAIAKALAEGKTLEQAASVAGLAASKIDGMTRIQPDPRLAGAPEVVGALFAARPGQVVGPIRLLNGWYFARADGNLPADPALFQQIKGQLTNELLQQRQRAFLNNYLNQIRAQAKVRDLRFEPGL